MRAARVSRLIATIAMVALGSTVLAASPAGAEQAEEHVVVVGPGGVQAALNTASPGSTIRLLPDTYHERIDVAATNITLDGSGSGPVGGTLLEWPAAAGTGRCAPLAVVVCLAGNGNRVTNLRVDVSGSPANPNPLSPNFGIYGFFTAGATVDHVTVVGNGAIGPVGIFLAGTNGTIRGTQSSGLFTALGASEIDATIADNTASGNCNDIVVIDLGLVGVGPLGQASHVTVKGNRLQGPQICPPLQGEGIQLIGAPHSIVTGNVVSGLNDAAVFTNSRFDTITDNTSINNCRGIVVHDDGIFGPPGGGGNAVVRDNVVRGRVEAPCFLPAIGILVEGTNNTVVVDNHVNLTVNTPTSFPLGVPQAAAGMVAIAPVSPGAPPLHDDQFVDNQVHITVGPAETSGGIDAFWDGTGTNITFGDNHCKTSSLQRHRRGRPTIEAC